VHRLVSDWGMDLVNIGFKKPEVGLGFAVLPAGVWGIAHGLVSGWGMDLEDRGGFSVRLCW
jgi:hypothetical protein